MALVERVDARALIGDKMSSGPIVDRRTAGGSRYRVSAERPAARGAVVGHRLDHPLCQAEDRCRALA